MKKTLVLLIIAVFGIVSVNAKNEAESAITVQTYLNYNYSNKMYNGLSLSCLDSKSPFTIEVYTDPKQTQTKVKVSLYIPKKAFTDQFGDNLDCRLKYFRANEYKYYTPELTDLEKIKEFPIMDIPKEWSDEYSFFRGYIEIPWNGMTDPAFTNGKSCPVFDQVYVIVEDAQSGAVLNERISGNFINRYDGKYGFVYTAKQNSVVCDIYFMSEFPVKKAVPFIGFGCNFRNLDVSALNEGIEAAVQTYDRDPYNNYLLSYQLFDNLSTDENGIYHLSWEIKNLQGKFLDIDDYSLGGTIGLIIEGEEQETLNWGMNKEWGSLGYDYFDYEPVNFDMGVPPRPLNPDEVVNYPEFEIDNGVLLHYYGTGGNVVIPNSVTKINDYAFYKCNSLKSVTIPAGVTSIGKYAFEKCDNLTSVVIPSTVTRIGSNAFVSCSNLISVTIPNGVTRIEDRTFTDCYSLTSVSIPNTVTRIGKDAFSSCGFSSITIPNSVKSIGNGAFYGCYLQSITIPNSVKSIGSNAFGGYYTSITIPNSVISIGEGAFCSSTLKTIVLEEGNQFYTVEDGILFDQAKTVLMQCPAGLNKTTSTIPNTVKRIGSKAFALCDALKSIIIPNSVTSIGDNAFSDCDNLTSVVLSNSVTSIERAAFYRCINLTSIIIPNSVTGLGDGSFTACEKLKTMEVQWSTPLYVWSLFWDPRELSDIKLIVPKGTKSLYQVAQYWEYFEIVEGDYTGISPVNTSLTSVHVSNNVLSVNSAVAETISVYSLLGNRLLSGEKPAGEINIPIERIQDKVLIVKGSSGWVKKLINSQ
ncbi:hypothetical protein FACS189440_10560 [Bacteroidia bacterium]|nr:hypothetical protein FACS189440_10560 [Bacteroidia bacterium]